MTAIFHELIEDNMEVFMDDFFVFGSSFNHCLKNLKKMLKRCEETNLVLNWEKCHFMVKEGIVLRHKVSGSGIEVDKAKIKAISKLPYPTNVKAIRSFLGHAGFYKRFIKDLSQIARSMTQLLVKDTPFNFSKECIQAFDTLKCVENLAADHLSRLENPGLGKLTKAEIRVLFPEERLMAISDKNNELWYVDYANYLASQNKAYWAIKNCNLDLRKAGENCFLQINDLDEMRLDAYETSISYKERIKRWHDKRIKALTNYEKVDEVLLFNSRLRPFPGKQKSRWYEPFSVCKDMKNGAIELYDEDGNGFIVNKQRVKPYQKSILDTNKDDDITLDDEREVT
ncbi:hypothetical protein Tco_0557955 [Tanacetum coccineum]